MRMKQKIFRERLQPVNNNKACVVKVSKFYIFPWRLQLPKWVNKPEIRIEIPLRTIHVAKNQQVFGKSTGVESCRGDIRV